MMDYALLLLLLNLALGFYNVGIIWAHELDIFRSWKLVDKKDFPTVQLVHWMKLPYWVFTQVAVALIGGVSPGFLSPGGLTSVGHLREYILPGPRTCPHGCLLGAVAGEAERRRERTTERLSYQDNQDTLGQDAPHQRLRSCPPRLDGNRCRLTRGVDQELT